MNGQIRVSVIIATLGRPSLQACLDALKAQTLPRSEWELITWLKTADDANEYDQRNKAEVHARGEVLAFTDDDTVPPPDWLEKGLAHFERNPELRILTGPVEGDMWGQGWMKVDKTGWFIGANLWVRKSAFDEIGGFEATWGLDPPPRGWRGDTDIGWRMIDRFGEKAYTHAPDVVMVHPRMMQSQWDQRVEERFYLRHRARCLTLIAPYDPRICQFVVQQKLEKDPLVLEYLTNDQKVRADYARINAEGKVLDLGCSDGWTFHGTTFDVVNFDLDRYSLGSFVQGEATCLPFADGSFDTVHVGEVLEHIQDPEALIREALRVSKKLVLITTPAEREWDPSKAPMLTREERMIKDGFKTVDAMQQHFTGQKLGVKKVLLESQFPHTWHMNWPTEEGLEALFSKLGIKHEVGKISQSGFVWFVIRIFKS